MEGATGLGAWYKREGTVDAVPRESFKATGYHFSLVRFDHFDLTLATCRMGRNRSGFVAALALRLLGVPAKEALRVVRSRRKDAMGVRAISNPEFQRLLLRT